MLLLHDQIRALGQVGNPTDPVQCHIVRIIFLGRTMSSEGSAPHTLGVPNVAIQGNAEAIQVIATMMEDLLTRAPASGDSWRAGNEEAGKVAIWIGFLISTFHLAKPREIDHPVFIPPSVWHSLIGVLPQESYCLIGETNKKLVQRLNRLNAEFNAIRRRNRDLHMTRWRRKRTPASSSPTPRT